MLIRSRIGDTQSYYVEEAGDGQPSSAAVVRSKYRVGRDLAGARSGRGLAISFREDQGMSVGADASRLRPAVRRCRGFDTERRPAGNGGAPFGYLDGAVQCASAL